jgi:hypothetical protein
MASQLEQIAGIYGAIDRVLQEDRSRVPDVAALLGGYRFDGSVGWFDGFAEYVKAKTDGKADLRRLVPESLDAAVNGIELQGVEDDRLLARSLLAIAAAMAADPELNARGARAEVVRRTLAPFVARRELVETSELEEIAGSRRVRDLHNIISFELRTMDQWDTFAHLIAEQEYAERSFAMAGAFKPCFGELVTVDLGDDEDPVPCISTTAYPEGLSYDDAKAHLQPANWPGASPLWCLMTPTRQAPNGNPIFHEIVSLNCPDKQHSWTVETELEFSFVEFGTKAISSYCLPQDIDMVTFPDILVDEGSLSVEQLADGRLEVKSSKRVKFAEPFDGTWLPMLTCAFGYGAAGTELVLQAAKKKQQNDSVPFVGKPPGGATVPDASKNAAKTQKGSGSKQTTGATAVDEDLGKLITDSTAVFQKCVDDSLIAFTASYEKVSAGTYTANDWIGDLTNMWKVMARDSAMMFDYGIKASQTLAEKARDLATDDESDIEKVVKKAGGARKVVPKKPQARKPAGPVRKGPVR